MARSRLSGGSPFCQTPRSRRDRLCEVGGSKLRWAAALQSLTRSAARRSQPPVVALAGEKKKDGVVPWTLDRTGKALRRSHVAAAVTLKASSTTRATVRPRPEVVDTAEATQEAARHAGQAAREMRSGARRARLFRRSCADVSSSLLHSGLSSNSLTPANQTDVPGGYPPCARPQWTIGRGASIFRTLEQHSFHVFKWLRR